MRLPDFAPDVRSNRTANGTPKRPNEQILPTPVPTEPLPGPAPQPEPEPEPGKPDPKPDKPDPKPVKPSPNEPPGVIKLVPLEAPPLTGDRNRSSDPWRRSMVCRFPEIAGPGGACTCASGYIRFKGMCSLPPRNLQEFSKPAKKPSHQLTRIPAALKSHPSPLNKPLGIAGFGTEGRQCLDPDLYQALTGAYGARPGLEPCAAGCVPRPAASLTSWQEIDARAKEANISWCAEDCIGLSGYLPAEEVLRLEQLTGRTFCMANGAALCSTPGFGAVDEGDMLEKLAVIVGERSNGLPSVGDVALVIGNRDYQGDIPTKETALRDSAAIKALMLTKLGLSPEHVIMAENKGLADLRALFAEGGPLDLRKPQGNLFIYISAQGFANPVNGKARILGVDTASAQNPQGFELEELYTAIRRIGAPSTTLILEVNFRTSLGALIEAPNFPETEIAVLPEEDIPGLSVFTASDRDQHTLVDPELGTGLFTRHIIEGLSGAADLAPIGNGDKRIEAVELYVYTAHRVRVSARKVFGLEQRPLLSQARNSLIGSY